MIGSASTKRKTAAFSVVGNTHILFRGILRKGGLADDANAITIQRLI
jgi:ABC-type nitrate/sulfonate/bicarbonate transport system substrate-binding protein